MFLRKLSFLIPPPNYITFHYLYFFVSIFIFCNIFWLSSTPQRSIAYVDCLFIVTSAMTETGLNTINLSQVNTFQQALLFVLMIGGSPIFVSFFVILIRKRAFESRFSELVEYYKAHRGGPSQAIAESPYRPFPSISANERWGVSNALSPKHEIFLSKIRIWLHFRTFGSRAGNSITNLDPCERPENQISPFQERCAYGSETAIVARLKSTEDLCTLKEAECNARRETNLTALNTEKISPLVDPQTWVTGDRKLCCSNYLEQCQSDNSRRDGISWLDTSERNWPDDATISPSIGNILSRTVSTADCSLTREDRIELGGAEYRAIKLLGYLIPAYFIIWQLLGCISIALHISVSDSDVGNLNAVNSWWLGMFLGVSAFTNCGLSLLDSGMTPFGKDIYLMVTLSLLIMAGNIAFPIILRLFLWLLSKAFSRNAEHQNSADTIRFILKYPRRVYTNIFPSAHTWWLLFALLSLTAIDWASFEILNMKNLPVISISFPFREAVEFFQSISIRSAGFTVVPVNQLAVGTQFISLVMMYISAYPVLITLRTSNVYEERSLGIFRDELKHRKNSKRAGEEGITESTVAVPRFYFLRQQLRHQLAHDIWWLTVSAIAIVCLEAGNYNRDPVTYSIFNMIFEVVSAYGPVGLSTGLPTEAYSLSGGFCTASKVIIIAVMIRGRHRGLPVAIDKAVLLQGELSDHGEGVGHWMRVRNVGQAGDELAG